MFFLTEIEEESKVIGNSICNEEANSFNNNSTKLLLIVMVAPLKLSLSEPCELSTGCDCDLIIDMICCDSLKTKTNGSVE